MLIKTLYTLRVWSHISCMSEIVAESLSLSRAGAVQCVLWRGTLQLVHSEPIGQSGPWLWRLLPRFSLNWNVLNQHVDLNDYIGTQRCHKHLFSSLWNRVGRWIGARAFISHWFHLLKSTRWRRGRQRWKAGWRHKTGELKACGNCYNLCSAHYKSFCVRVRAIVLSSVGF